LWGRQNAQSVFPVQNPVDVGVEPKATKPNRFLFQASQMFVEDLLLRVFQT
jgi:hypothetical protein